MKNLKILKMMIMKKVMMFGMLVLGVTLTAFAQLNSSELIPETPTGAAAMMMFTETSHDFGEIEKGIPVEHTFLIRNDGDAPLLISRVKTSCGCTATDYSREAIMPGDEGMITVSYNAANSGSFNKAISVISNGGEEILSVKGIVL
jgi:hypothetical protein